MTFDEFVEKHGEEVWDEYVGPIKNDKTLPPHLRANASAIVDDWITRGNDIPNKISEIRRRKNDRS